MIVETFLLMRKYSQLKSNRDKVMEKYTTYRSPELDQTIKNLSSIMLVIIIVAVILFVMCLFAMVDASRNCGNTKLVHILLLFFIPAYLPFYIILRLGGVICNN